MSAVGWCWDETSTREVFESWAVGRPVAEIEAAEDFLYGVAQDAQWPNRPGSMNPDRNNRDVRYHDDGRYRAEFGTDLNGPVGRLVLGAFMGPGDSRPHIPYG